MWEFVGVLFEKSSPHTPAKTFKKWDLEARALLLYTLNIFAKLFVAIGTMWALSFTM